MSFSATCWAWSVKGLKSSEKLTLLAVCQYANEETKKAYPSIKTIVECTGLNQKTVQANLNKLIDKCLLIDSGKRVGLTKSCKVFIVPFLTYSELSDPKNGITQNEAIPKTDVSDPKNGSEAIPKTGSKPVIEPVRNINAFFSVFWKNWRNQKKRLGIENVGSKKDAENKFKTLFKKHSEEELQIIVNSALTKLVTVVDDLINNESASQYFNYRNMYPQKFLDSEDWLND